MKPVVIFDLDGTLVDTVPVCIEIVDSMLADRGVAHSTCAIQARALASVGGPAMISALLGQACGDPNVEIVEFRDRYRHHLTPADSAFAGVAAGLSALSAAGIRLAICSNKPQGLCEKVLTELALREYFEVVVGGHPDRAPKPAPDLLDATLAALQCSASDCVFVGDSDLDHRIAADAGIPFVFVEYGYADPAWEVPTVERAARFEDVVAVLLGGDPVRVAA